MRRGTLNADPALNSSACLHVSQQFANIAGIAGDATSE